MALTPDLADRAQITSVAADARFVGAAALLPAAADGADVVVVDLTRAGILEVLADLVATGARVVAFAPHVDTALLAAGLAAGAEAVPRSRFFRDVGAFIGTKQS